jgi:hypothetical protein
MEQPKTAKATLDNASTTTGRDGAVDFAARATALDSVERGDEPARFVQVMGAALIDLWGDLPQPVQEQLFERAVVLGHRGEQDEMLREQLAKFLHDHHKRTAGQEMQR